ncbi:hypothetical protein [Pedobacter jamesrossensis]|uniref:Preprotein translocase subunit SecE n=1 Tax=Pedobacter jamesrossensis TaxID=1908238 RepID=A0ABV8NJM4_9SPHI
MDNKIPTSEEFATYRSVQKYIEAKMKKDGNRFSVLQKLDWLMAIITGVIAFLCSYGLTILLFGGEFWIRTVSSGIMK